MKISRLIVAAAALVACTPAARHTLHLHYLDRPAAFIMDDPSQVGCAISETGIRVQAIPPSVCPDIRAVDEAARRVISIAKSHGAQDGDFIGSTMVFGPWLMSCGDQHWVTGCEDPLHWTIALQDHAPLGWGFPWDPAEHELMSLELDTLGIEQGYSRIDGTHWPLWAFQFGVDRRLETDPFAPIGFPRPNVSEF